MNPLSSDPCRKQPLASKQPSPRQGRPQLCGPCETTWLSMEGHGGTMPGHQGHAMPGHEGHAMPDHGSHTGSDCAMTMSWNTYTRDMCIVSPAWHIRSSHAFVFSLLLIFGISVSYEYLKWVVRCIDIAIVRLESAQSPLGRMRDGNNASTNATASLLRTRPTNTRRIIPMTYSDLVASDAAEERGENEDSLSTKHTAKATPRALRILLHTVRSLLYGVQVSIACFLMLVMMTYNAWLIGAIVAGAVFGAFFYNRTPKGATPILDDKGTACH